MKNTIAALLHDIGKFYQRTETKLGNGWYQQFVKQNGSYVHGGFTAKFIDENIKSNLPEYSEMLKLSASHHIDNFSIVKKADIIASSHDRKDADLNTINLDEENESENFITKRQNIIFNEVSIEGLINTPYEYSLSKLSDLRVNKNSNLSKQEARKEYQNLYNEMKKELDEMNKKGYSTYEELHQLIYPIIKEYTTTIPGSTFNQVVPTVSLFDHLKLTTAIVNCLEKTETKDFIFIDYDISGIQKFIYRITEGGESKSNIAKLLRTRSFYLNVLIDFIAYYIVKELGLTYENVLYSSGGRGRILAPKTIDFYEKIKVINTNIEQCIFNMHHGEISFAIKCCEITSEKLMSSSIEDLVNDNFIVISDKKRKFNSIFKDEKFNSVLEADENLCLICNSNSVNEKEYCDFCEKLLEINNKILTTANEFIVEFVYDNLIYNDRLAIKIGNLGTIIFHLTEDFKLSRSNSFYLSINCHFVGETKTYAKSNIGAKSFEEIAKNSLGDPKIAVLKMDVDNLGYIFMKGINGNYDTISKNLTLSRMVDYFFTKKIVEIANKDIYQKSIYINYAGGDDLVIVMPASMSLELVRDINNEFSKFTGLNKSFHISAGLEIFDYNTPVRYAITRAEENLTLSKKQINKNSFSILRTTFSNEKIDDLIAEVDIFTKALVNEDISRNNLYEIYNFILKGLESEKKEQAFMRFIPLIAYTIKRNMKDEWFEKMKNIFVVQNISIETLEYYKVVFSMALMKSRKRG